MPTTSNFGWTTPADTDLVKDGAAAIRTLGNGVDTSFVDLKGGTTGQVLAKASGSDLDFSWVTTDDANAIQNAIVDAKGDLIAASAADTPARLAVGTNGQILIADSTTSTGLRWGTGGKVLQVVMDDLTSDFSTTSTSFVDTGLEVTITPSATSSKILIGGFIYGYIDHSGAQVHCYAETRLLRGATQITGAAHGVFNFASSTGKIIYYTNSYNFLDSPNTTSATTYKIQGKASAATSTTFRIQGASSYTAQIIAMEIGA